MDIGRSFKYMFEDEGWIMKVVIGGILGIIPIVNFITLGYMVEVIRQVSNGQELPLPDWEDFGGKFMKGLMVVIGYLIYSIPLIVLYVIVAIITAIVGGMSGSNSDSAGGIVGICWAALSCVAFLYSVVVYGLLIPPALMRYAETSELNAFFRFGENWRVVTSNLGPYLVMLLVIIGASLVAQIVGTIACVIGILFTAFWSYLVMAHLMGQYWQQQRSVA